MRKKKLKLDNLTEDQLRDLIAQEEKKIQEADLQENAKAKLDGYLYRIDAWVHPSQGDDRQICFFSKEQPSDQEIAVILKKKRSRVLNDFVITKL